jgi:transcriptional regulator with XRE-family HTH domain
MLQQTYTDAHHSLGEKLRSMRVSAHLTQAEVARLLGRPQSFVSKVESGQHPLDFVECVQFAQAVGADPAELIRAVAEELARVSRARNCVPVHEGSPMSNADESDKPQPSRRVRV